MREMLFRAKRIDNDEWVEGDLSYLVHNKEKMYVFPTDGLDSADRYEVDPETLCQYTGKPDEDGKKIFDGDIVGFIDLYSTESGYSEHSCVGQVLWDEEECCFHVTDRLSAESWEVLNECKVIGNVFDDKELLEEV